MYIYIYKNTQIYIYMYMYPCGPFGFVGLAEGCRPAAAERAQTAPVLRFVTAGADAGAFTILPRSRGMSAHIFGKAG